MSTFDKIIGYKTEKQELLMLGDILKNSKKYHKLGISTPKAILLYGDPGLGKTLMAKALIEESGRVCFPCRKNRADGEFVAIIKETFDKASENAPSIIFLDDMDKFAEDNLRQDSNKEEFATIQSCMEDIKEKEVFVVATANDIDNLPGSLLRSGRFGRKIEVKAPLFEDEVKIIEYYLKSKSVSTEISPEMLAYILHGQSCAVLEEIINEAGIYAGFDDSSQIEKKHLIPAIQRVINASISQKELTAEQKTRVAYHEAGHAIIGLLCGNTIGMITVSPYGNSLGKTYFYRPSSRQFVYYDFEKEILISLGGMAASEVVFGDKDFGASSDLEDVTKYLREHIEKSGVEGFEYLYDFHKWDNKQSFKRIDSITEKVTEMLNSCYEKTKKMLSDNMELLYALADALVTNDVLLYDDILEIVHMAVKP